MCVACAAVRICPVCIPASPLETAGKGALPVALPTIKTGNEEKMDRIKVVFYIL